MNRNAFHRRFALRKCACGQRFRKRSNAEHCSNACRQRAYRKRQRPPVVTVYATNADAIGAAARLYIPNGAIVADVTYGRGTFWKKTNTRRFELRPSDLCTTEQPVGFRSLPYQDRSVDIVVLDPPSIHTTGTHMTELRYNHGTTNGFDHAGIMELYKQGMLEAVRVLKPGGQLWIKCADEIESGRAAVDSPRDF